MIGRSGNRAPNTSRVKSGQTKGASGFVQEGELVETRTKDCRSIAPQGCAGTLARRAECTSRLSFTVGDETGDHKPAEGTFAVGTPKWGLLTLPGQRVGRATRVGAGGEHAGGRLAPRDDRADPARADLADLVTERG